MKKVFIYFYTLLFFMLICGCGEPEQQESNIMLYLEENAAINSFPLVIVISDRLNGDAFPEDMKRLCGLSRYTCKTLPVAGIVRLGQGIYYSYNSLGALKINESVKGNEAALTAEVDKQVTTYQSKTLLKEYDSLLTPNQPEWNIKNLSLNYVNNTTDSVFFFSAVPNSPAVVQVGNRNFNVYTDVNELRKSIDEIVCRAPAAISVFYTPHPFDSSKAAVVSTRYPPIGTNAGDTCVNGSKFQRLHNGRGGFSVGNLLERNSRSCGFTYPTGVAGDTCVNGSKFQRLHNGRGGFRVGKVLERNSQSCGFAYPARGIAALGYICFKGSKYLKLHDGKGGYMRGNIVEANSADCEVNQSDNTCFRKSEPECEQEGGSYTGRRVQYCYNRAGRIIQTIVLSKCDSDCRCLGR